MERITARSEGDFFTVLYGSLWIAALSAIWFFCRADPEAPVKYVVEPPEQANPGWKGEVLEKPTLKVLIVYEYTTVRQLTYSGLGILPNTMLRPCNRRSTRARQPLYSRWHRPRN
jgi:hypothetical protein